MPVFFCRVLTCSAWPVRWGGLAALCLVSRRSVWYRGALLRGLSQCRCECELVSPCESLSSRVPVAPLPLRSKHRGTTVSSAIDPAPCWEDGMVASAEEGESSASSTSSEPQTAPLRSSPSSALPEDSSQGSRERKKPFQDFKRSINIFTISIVVYLYI